MIPNGSLSPRSPRAIRRGRRPPGQRSASPTGSPRRRRRRRGRSRGPTPMPPRGIRRRSPWKCIRRAWRRTWPTKAPRSSAPFTRKAASEEWTTAPLTTPPPRPWPPKPPRRRRRPPRRRWRARRKRPKPPGARRSAMNVRARTTTPPWFPRRPAPLPLAQAWASCLSTWRRTRAPARRACPDRRPFCSCWSRTRCTGKCSCGSPRA
mmetsp:Transcript_12640/g.36304  ORF Transcript_12640/g.36304 Transcript_12640/m.36304 type:complete len:207 (-) Transcript_12640:440-1060(-)